MAKEGKKTLLLVEDEAIIAMTEKKLLEDEGYNVIHTFTGEEAVEKVRSKKDGIDLILMDIDLGKGMDGTLAAKEILNDLEVPVVFLSSHVEQKIVDKTEKITSYGYVVKNTGERVLLASIKMAFKLFDAHKNIQEQKSELISKSNELQATIEELQATNEEIESINEQLVRSEQELMRSEAFLNSVIEDSPHPTWIADASGTLIRINKSCQDMLNITADDVVGKYNVLNDNIVIEQGYLPLVRNVFEKGEPARFELVYDSSYLKQLKLKNFAFVILDVNIFPIKDGNGNITNAVIQHNNITARKLAEEELKRSRVQHQMLIDSIPDTAVMLFDPNFRYIIAGGEELARIGFAKGRIEGLTLAEACPPDVAEFFAPLYSRALKGEQIVIERKYKDSIYHQQIFPVKDEEGNIIAGISIVHNITASKRIEEFYKASVHRMKVHLTETPVAVIEWDMDFCITSWNPAAERIFGYGAVEAIGSHGTFIVPENARTSVGEVWEQLISKKGGQRSINENITKDKRIILCNWYNTTLTSPEGEIIGAASIVQDITEQRAAEERIISLLHEKENILKEVHHRIKNNMNIIISLLTLQARKQGDESLKNILLDSAGRVQSMMVLYDKLYGSDINNTLNLKDYIPALVNEIIGIFPRKDSVSAVTNIEDIVLSTKTLSSLGVIINELITNSVKYAFQDDKTGTIKVTASKKGDLVELIFEDNGPGMPEHVTQENSSGFGLKLVVILVKQLRGSISIERKNGTKFIIQIPG